MKKSDYVESCGNIYADLGRPNAAEMLVKAELVVKIMEETDRRRLTQMQAAELLGIDQPKISALRRGHFKGFSIERLLKFLLLLDFDIEITIKKKPKSRASGQLRTT